MNSAVETDCWPDSPVRKPRGRRRGASWPGYLLPTASAKRDAPRCTARHAGRRDEARAPFPRLGAARIEPAYAVAIFRARHGCYRLKINKSAVIARGDGCGGLLHSFYIEPLDLGETSAGS